MKYLECDLMWYMYIYIYIDDTFVIITNSKVQLSGRKYAILVHAPVSQLCSSYYYQVDCAMFDGQVACMYSVPPEVPQRSGECVRHRADDMFSVHYSSGKHCVSLLVFSLCMGRR